MTATSFAIFATSIGACGLAWQEGRVVGVQLPERSEAETRQRLARRFGSAREEDAPPAMQAVIGGIVALLAGEPRDFADVDLDMSRLPAFDRLVYDAARRIPAGQTRTYGQLAAEAGAAGAAQAVGRTLGRNPFPIVVPCHRVLAAGGRIGGFSANGGIDTKRRILAIESRHATGESGLFDALLPST